MPAASPQSISRPLAELLVRHPGYGFAGTGVSMAIGNYAETGTDLFFPAGLPGLSGLGPDAQLSQPDSRTAGARLVSRGRCITRPGRCGSRCGLREA